MFQSSLVPQKPLSDVLWVQLLPAELVLPVLLSRCSYMANRNSLSFTIGPEAHTLALVKLRVLWLDRTLTRPSA